MRNSRRMRQAVHLAHMEKKRNANKDLIGNPE
jgi:hypothetical protein